MSGPTPLAPRPSWRLAARYLAAMTLPRKSDYAGLSRSWRSDLMAGLTVGVVALPLALGFGVASGVGAAAGLVTAVVAGFVAAVFDGYDAGLGKIITSIGGRRTANALAKRFQGALLSLARTGSPGADWPQYEEPTRRTRIFDIEDRVESDPWADRRLAWGNYRGHR